MLYRTDPVLSQAQQIVYHPLSGKVLASLVFEKRHPIVVLLIHCHLKHNKEPSSFFACILAFVKQSVCFFAAPHFAHFPRFSPFSPPLCCAQLSSFSATKQSEAAFPNPYTLYTHFPAFFLFSMALVAHRFFLCRSFFSIYAVRFLVQQCCFPLSQALFLNFFLQLLNQFVCQHCKLHSFFVPVSFYIIWLFTSCVYSIQPAYFAIYFTRCPFSMHCENEVLLVLKQCLYKPIKSSSFETSYILLS